MMWQDLVLSIANIAFTYSIMIQVIKGFRDKVGHMAWQTSFITFIGLLACAVVYQSLGLTYAMVLTSISSGLWGILFYQKVVYTNVK